MARPSVLWVTNIAAPYRLPVWAALARDFRLTVGLLEHHERLKLDTAQNRGSDWRPYTVEGVRIVEFGTVVGRRGEARHYGLYDHRALSMMRSSDVVLLGGWDSPAYLQMMAIARLLRRPTVTFYESTLASQQRVDGLMAAVRRQFFRMSDRVVVPGPAAKDAILAMGVPKDRIHTGFNAVDVASFAAPPYQPSQDGSHRYLYVGQLIERKNVEGLIRAFAASAKPVDSLTIVGTGHQEAGLVALSRRLGVAQRVHMKGWLPNRDLPAVMARHETLVLCSRQEVWGLVVNEALAAGMTVVVTNNCGVVPSIRGMPGVVVARADGSDLDNALTRVSTIRPVRIVNPPILLQTPDKFAAVFAEAFDEVIAHHGHGNRRLKKPSRD